MTTADAPERDVTTSYEVAHQREVDWLAQALVIAGMEAVLVGAMTLDDLLAYANTLNDPREESGRAHRMTTARRRPDGFREEAREQAGYSLRKIVERSKAAGR